MKNKMPSIPKIRSKMSVIVHLAAWCVLSSCTAYGQTAQSQANKIADDIEKVRQGKFALLTVEEIAKAGAVQAIPILEEQFLRSEDITTKAKISSALVRLGDKDETYWNYLVEQATFAVESDAPDPTYDAQGKDTQGKLSPEIVAWAKAHNVSADSAAEDALFVLPGKVLLLGEVGDPRGIPLLQRALQSPNYMIEVAAATGLAQVQDKNSIPLIIEACWRAPADAATAIAGSLVFFDDPQAQSAVDTYMPKEFAKASREARAQGKKPFGY